MNKQIWLIFILILSLTISIDGHAWKYNEHAYITYQAYDSACAAIKGQIKNRKQIEDYAAYCENPLIKLCFSHMVALSGDWVADYEKISINKDSKFLNNGTSLNCSDLSNIEGSDEIIKITSDNKVDSSHVIFQDVLTNTKTKAFLQWAKLVSDNETHFQPRSVLQWNKWTDEAYSLVENQQDMQVTMAAKAFGLHFLEDSFSAGHNGLNRSLRRHNYDQAYHDGFNHTGMLLESFENKFYVYGDSNLDQKTVYIKFHDHSQENISAALSEIQSVTGMKFIKTPETFIKKISEKLDTSEPSIKVLSLPMIEETIEFKSIRCIIFDDCNKHEFVVLNHLDFFDVKCEPNKHEYFTVAICPSSSEYVTEQTSKSIESFFTLVILGDKTRALEITQEVTQMIPNKAYPITQDNRSMNSLINGKPQFFDHYKNPNLLCFKRNCDREEFKEYNFMTFGFSHETRLDNDDIIPSSSLGFILRGRISEKFSGRMENRYQLYNEKGKFLSSFDLSLFTPSKRIGRNLIGVYAKGSLGLDNIWEGEKRSRYAGLGLGFDAHFGSTTTFVEVDYLKHWGNRIFDDYSVRVMVGFRVSSLRMGSILGN
ncbi:hypothetical protein [Marinicella litoralis]|uniref:Uncharacterized protein n=1 Tax=Marinicella litoralis TaxID=644220 RepID=A0A4R6XB03_9GAMM|nr:hypothetical protein [Marinicella litoralis]TDR16372.1 hypothetical protein C8D91_2899 [Marinicella litoralis]